MGKERICSTHALVCVCYIWNSTYCVLTNNLVPCAKVFISISHSQWEKYKQLKMHITVTCIKSAMCYRKVPYKYQLSLNLYKKQTVKWTCGRKAHSFYKEYYSYKLSRIVTNCLCIIGYWAITHCGKFFFYILECLQLKWQIQFFMNNSFFRWEPYLSMQP